MSSIDEINLETSLSGFVASHKNISYVKNQGILLRNDEEFKSDKKAVILISGGGSGHEPFPGGFIGKGMLSAGVCGQIFTSPSVTSCLASILLASQHDEKREILMIINNYTGDRLNFGLAIETARNIYKYHDIKAITIDDDCAIENPHRSTGRRGLSGINLIIKIAGAMSAKGHSLNEIYERCTSLLSNRLIQTVGFSFHHFASNQLKDINIGYGIHGEPGILNIHSAKNFAPVIEIIIEKLKLQYLESNVILLFNNLGGASEFIFFHFIRDFMDHIKAFSFKVLKIYAGKFLTSLGKEGIGITVMQVEDEQLLEFLEYPTDVANQNLFIPLNFSYTTKELNFEIPNNHYDDRKYPVESSIKAEDDVKFMKQIIIEICNAINKEKVNLNEMDSELGDGDTGSTLSRGADAILSELSRESMLHIDNPHLFFLTISDIVMRSMGGTSGAIFSIFFQFASNAFIENNEYSINTLFNSISKGINGVMIYSMAEIGDRTLLDALNAGYESMKKIIEKKTYNSLDVVKAFASGCQQGAEETKCMRPKSGRAAYSLSNKESDYKFTSNKSDPGAYAVVLIAQNILNVFSTRA